MFINCPYCRALVATDPVSDLPPTHCPQCASLLRRDDSVIDDDPEPAAIDLGDLLDAPPAGVPAVDAVPAMDAGTSAPAVATAAATAAAHAQMDDDGVLAAPTPGAHPAAAVPPKDDTRVAPPAADAPAPSTPQPAAVLPARPARGMPSFVQGRGDAAHAPRERWLPPAIAALALLLALQWLLADRARLAADARWRPTLAVLCGTLGCELPPWREPAAFTLLQRDVRQHPTIPGALRVSASFRNDARWPQPWPRLRVRLSDANGRPAGERDFDVDAYLGGPPGQAELASGDTATIAMDLLEPAPQIVAYDFSFH